MKKSKKLLSKSKRKYTKNYKKTKSIKRKKYQRINFKGG